MAPLEEELIVTIRSVKGVFIPNYKKLDWEEHINFVKGCFVQILYDFVAENCPDYTSEQITDAILNLIEESGGSLEEMSRQEILETIRGMLR